MLQDRPHEQGQLALSFAPERRVLAVSELTAAMQLFFDREFQGIWVTGEISGCRPSSAGHYYFSLKDRDAQLKCVLFKSALRFAKFRPQDGLAVIVRGNLDIYAPRGEYQLIVETLEPQGAGALQIAFEQLKKKLAAEGLFDPERKRPLPRLPRRIGLITSQSGAVLRDILHVLARRFPGLHLRLFPAQVQGDGAAQQVCSGLHHFSRQENLGRPWADIIIVARGGGSIEDLWTFNEESVARAVAASRVPVISAIGHETDFTICDFVADHRAPTPSAAAEIVICTKESLFEQMVNCRAKLTQALRYHLLVGHRQIENVGAERTGRLLLRGIAKRTQMLDDADARLRRTANTRLGIMRDRLAELINRLERTDLRLRLARHNYRNQQLTERLFLLSLIAKRSKSMDDARAKLVFLIGEAFARRRRRLETQASHLSQLSPLTVLQRGYAIVETRSGHVLRSASEASPGEALHVRLGTGELDVTVVS